MTQLLPPKKEVALALLERSNVDVYLDPRAKGVVVPPQFRKEPRLILKIGLNMPVPIPDLRARRREHELHALVQPLAVLLRRAVEQRLRDGRRGRSRHGLAGRRPAGARREGGRAGRRRGARALAPVAARARLRAAPSPASASGGRRKAALRRASARRTTSRRRAPRRRQGRAGKRKKKKEERGARRPSRPRRASVPRPRPARRRGRAADAVRGETLRADAERAPARDPPASRGRAGPRASRRRLGGVLRVAVARSARSLPRSVRRPTVRPVRSVSSRRTCASSSSASRRLPSAFE